VASFPMRANQEADALCLTILYVLQYKKSIVSWQYYSCLDL
jgi:hypothetical protein